MTRDPHTGLELADEPQADPPKNRRITRKHVATGAATLAVVGVGGLIAGVSHKHSWWWYHHHQSTPAPLNLTAHEFASPTGTTTCTRNAGLVGITAAIAANNVCSTYDKAQSIALNGDQIPVEPGTFPATNVGAGAIELTTANARTSNATFVCDDSRTGVVLQGQDAADFTIKTTWVGFQGSCFYFHVMEFDYGGDTVDTANHVTIDGVHMDSFKLNGADNVAIKNSQIGPSLFCYGAAGGTAAQRCSNFTSDPIWGQVATYFAGWATGSQNWQMEPFIHPHSGVCPGAAAQGVQITNDTFRDMQSTDTTTMHTGGLLVDGAACQAADWALTFDRDTWEHNMTYGIEFDGPATDTTLQNSWIGQGFGALGVGQQDTANGRSAEWLCRGTQVASNQLIRFNSADGSMSYNATGDASASGCWSNFRVIGNINVDSSPGGVACGGLNTTYPGVTTMDYVAIKTNTCGTNASSISALPFISSSFPIDFRLTTTTGIPTVPAAGSPTITNLTAGHSGSIATSYTTASVAPTSNALVLVDVWAHTSSGSPVTPTLTGGGMSSWTLVATNSFPAINMTLFIFRALQASPTSGTLLIDFAAGSLTNTCLWLIDQVSGADTTGTNGSGAVVQNATNTASGVTSIAPTLASFASASNTTYQVAGHNKIESQTVGASMNAITGAETGDAALGNGFELKSESGTNVLSPSQSWTTSSQAETTALELKTANPDYSITTDYYGNARNNPTRGGAVGP